MRSLRWFALLVLVAAQPAAAALAWSQLKGDLGRYQILLPGTASVDNETVEADGTKLHDMAFEQGAGGIYRFRVADHPAGYGDERPKGERLQDLQDKWIAAMPGAKLLNAKTVTQANWLGRAFSYTTDGGKLIHQARIYLVGNRVYQLDAAVPAGGSAKVSASVVKFLSSFKILKE